MASDTFASDIRTICSLREAVEILTRYAEDELECQGHGIDVSTALVLTVQTANDLHAQITALEGQLADNAKVSLGLHQG